MSPTFGIRHHNSGLSVIRRNGTTGTTVTPLTLTTLVMSPVIHLCRAPGLKQRENILNFGRLAVMENENKLQMLIKHWIKHGKNDDRASQLLNVKTKILKYKYIQHKSHPTSTNVSVTGNK